MALIGQEESRMAEAVISVVGNVGGTPEYVNTPSGQEILKFSVAVNGRNGETTWYRISQFNPHRKFTDFIDKGSLVRVDGTFLPREYTNKDGQTKMSMDVTAFDRGVNFVGGKRDSEGGGGSSASSNDDVPF